MSTATLVTAELSLARDRRVMPGPSAKADFNHIQPDPSQVGGVAEAPFARRPDPKTLFAARADRLRALSDSNTLGSYLQFLARIVDAQAGAVAALPAPLLPPDSKIALAAEHGMPPLGGQSLRETAEFATTLAWMLDHTDLSDAPEAARAAADAVRAMSDDQRLTLASDIMEGGYPLDRVAEALFVAAAVQVHLTGQAAQLDAAVIHRSEHGTCPACGGVPVSSVVVGWTQASKARYCACSLCGTLWNHVRIKCTACGSTDGVAYYTIEDGDKTVGIETCTTCRSYIKHMQQHEDRALDPVADDVATYALDLLAREQDFRRSSINPLFLTG